MLVYYLLDSVGIAFHALVWFARTRPRCRYTVLTLVVLISSVTPALAAGDDDGTTGPRCAVFNGQESTFMAWFISFGAWVSWRKPELAALLDPAAARTAGPGDARDKWDMLNVQLYGALVSFVSAPLQASLFVSAMNDGVAAVKALRTRFGSTTGGGGDRAAAMSRVLGRYIDPKAPLSEADVVNQHDKMQLAVADVVAGGGTAPDDLLLISMFENSLPSLYSTVRQLVRYKAHTTLSAYYSAVGPKVRASFSTYP